MEIASQHVTTFCCCNTSSRLHSRAAFGDSLFDQSLACMKQRLEGKTESLSIRRAHLPLLLLALLALALPFSGCVKRSRETSLSSKPSDQAAALSQTTQTKANDQQPTASPQTNSLVSHQQSLPRININTASANELETLPGIGKGLAARIVDHREKYGPFRRTEHLIIVRGIGDRRFRALRDLITVE